MVFSLLYPIFVLVLLRMMGLIQLRRAAKIIGLASTFLFPLFPFILIFLRYLYSQINYLKLSSIPLIIIQVALLPLTCILLLHYFLRTYKWWQKQDIAIVIILVDLVLTISNSIMNHTNFIFADLFIVPLISMSIMHSYITLFLLRSKNASQKIDASLNKNRLRNKIDKYYIFVVLFIVMIAVLAIRFGKLGYYFSSYTFTCIALLFGYGSLLLLFYLKQQEHSHMHMQQQKKYI